MRVLALSLLGLFMVTGCNSFYQPQVDEKITVAKAQNDIKIGMSSSEVIEILGSPNIISTDRENREVWVYDKISTQFASNGTSGGIGIPLIAGISGNKASSVKNQRTLTIVVKFDGDKKVRDVAYRTSSF